MQSYHAFHSNSCFADLVTRHRTVSGQDNFRLSLGTICRWINELLAQVPSYEGSFTFSSVIVIFLPVLTLSPSSCSFLRALPTCLSSVRAFRLRRISENFNFREVYERFSLQTVLPVTSVLVRSARNKLAIISIFFPTTSFGGNDIIFIVAVDMMGSS
jgi:hypothetical protein